MVSILSSRGKYLGYQWSELLYVTVISIPATSREVRDTDGRVCLVDALTASAAAAHGVYLQILRKDFNVQLQYREIFFKCKYKKNVVASN